MILKIWKLLNQEGIAVNNSKDKLRVVDITEDPRAKILPKTDFVNKTYEVASKTYIARNSFIMKIASWQARLHGRDPNIGALYFKHEGNDVVIIGKKGYVFWNGKSVEPRCYSILSVPSHQDIQKMIDDVEPEMAGYKVKG